MKLFEKQLLVLLVVDERLLDLFGLALFLINANQFILNLEIINQ
jgi:hypothetical protein